MKYKKLKRKKIYRKAKDIEVYVNGEGPYEEMYFPGGFSNLTVVGTGSMKHGEKLMIDLVCGGM